MFIAIAKAFEQFEHTAFGIVNAKLSFDTSDGFFGGTHLLIEPSGELLELRGVEGGGIADILRAALKSKLASPALLGLAFTETIILTTTLGNNAARYS